MKCCKRKASCVGHKAFVLVSWRIKLIFEYYIVALAFAQPDRHGRVIVNVAPWFVYSLFIEVKLS